MIKMMKMYKIFQIMIENGTHSFIMTLKQGSGVVLPQKL